MSEQQPNPDLDSLLPNSSGDEKDSSDPDTIFGLLDNDPEDRVSYLGEW